VAPFGALLTAAVVCAAGVVGSAGVAQAAKRPTRAAHPAANRSRGLTPEQAALNSMIDTTVASVTGDNGDQNPYDLAVVPITSGKLVAGNVLVALFNDVNNTQGAGTTIMQINPATGDASVFAHGDPVTGPVGIAISPNDTVWLGDYGGTNNTHPNVAVIKSDGTLVATYDAATTAAPPVPVPAPVFEGVWGQAVSNTGGHIAFYWPNAGDPVTGAGGGGVYRVNPGANPANNQPLHSTYQLLNNPLLPATPPTAGGTAANAVGPRGMVFDNANHTLYVTDDANNTIYAIANADSAAAPAAAAVVLATGLNSPQQITLNPLNGDLLVVDGATDNIMTELTTSGTVVATLALAPGDPPGSLFGLTATTDKVGNLVIYYDDAATTTLHSLTMPSLGYWMAASDGGVFTFGDAGFFGSLGNIHLNQPIVAMTPTPDGQGYWMVASDGGVFTFGDAPFFGSLGAIKLNKPIVGMAATSDGGGYWLVASDGGVFTFGDATFLGSLGAIKLNKPVVGMADFPAQDGDPANDGYWLVASDGGIFSFNAPFFGSTGNVALNKPIVGMTAQPDGSGYRFVASDGGVFDFGSAEFFGSTGNIPLNKPIVGMATTADSLGYTLFASDGGVFTFGNAKFYGSLGNIQLNQPIVGAASVP
jgi:sugar lactone lactonase YvrE